MKSLYAAITLTLACLHAQACADYFDYTYIVAASPKDRFQLPELSMAVELEKLPGDTIAPGKGSALPEGVTLRSLCDLAHPDEPYSEWSEADVDENTVADLTDLYTALTQSGASAEDATALCQKYYGIRFGFDERLSGYALVPVHLSIPELLTALSQLPKEFYLYFEGALAFHKGNYAEADARFEAILALPPEERKFKTTWALFMRGRIAVTCQRDPERAAMYPDLAVDPQHWFDQVRTAAAEGAIDSLNLAGGIYQQEALLASVKEDTVGEMQALARHVLVSDQESSAFALRSTCRALAEGENIAPGVMADRLCRSALAAFAASHVLDYPEECERLIKAFQASDLELTPYESGRLAWAAYVVGDFTQAANLLALAPEDPYSLWTQSRLHLREGNVEGALAALSKAAPQFPREESWSRLFAQFVDPRGPRAALHSEQGVLMLTRDRYVESLDLFLSGGNWVDAAFIAENVLTLDELQVYFQKCRKEGHHQEPLESVWWDGLYINKPDYRYNENDDYSSVARPDLLTRLGALMGRRMLREDRFDGASDYFPEDWKPLAQAYAQHRKAGAQAGKKADRARHLAQAGHLLRHWGIELIGREADPDFAYAEGKVYYGSTATLRQDLAKWTATDNGLIEVSEEEWSEAKGAEGEGEGTTSDDGENVAEEELASAEIPIDLTPLHPTAEERKRLGRHQAQPYQRWHYRYIAGKIFQEAADLLPNQQEEKAQALYYGGTVLTKVSNDKEALAQMDKRYKALVRTCGTLEIGKATAAARWFPEEPEDWSKAFSSDALYAAALEANTRTSRK